MVSSELHKLSYWEEIYVNEKKNYEESNIELEEWFEENCDKIMNWIDNKFSQNEEKKNITILDIGCGNGLFLYKLYEKGFMNLYGFDFSSTAIELAKTIFENSPIYVEVMDICLIDKEIQNSKLNKNYNLINDKGTFDVFFMNNKTNEYFKQISYFLQANTFFCITSCNACKDELLQIINEFNKNNLKIELVLIDEIFYETITYAGIKGQLITTLIFKCK
ncbi:methyltransferase, putative [Plasmodium reichenowi]|uniref:Protein-lysine N-methyltransferase PRG01_0924000 n=1 Tax=Plasmodium reichenowi TaxID=5854 RepID=A0A151LHL4_PLARE|nr:methyltransferase, putative [Plasmodium reichenowi]KYN98454.1 methyltransferase, putative [Plasmodium reichenowi]SOV78893.1 methyltransferase, putative [Plasmodium reichenowi]